MGGAGPIPATAIWQWEDRYLSLPWFNEAIRKIDTVWMGMVNDG